MKLDPESLTVDSFDAGQDALLYPATVISGPNSAGDSLYEGQPCA